MTRFLRADSERYSRAKELAEECFAKKTVKDGIRTSVSGAVLYRRIALGTLTRQKAMGM